MLGTLYARMAHLEAASVPAFLRLADELKAHGAPESLIQAARSSAADEVRHARTVGALARRQGVSVPEVEVPEFRQRSLEEMVVENAVEGCVRELFGALVAGWQSHHARDEEVRRVFVPIAEEELGHAELAWAIDDWANSRLSASTREHVRELRLHELRELRHQVAACETTLALVEHAGLPSRQTALRLLDGMSPLLA